MAESINENKQYKIVLLGNPRVGKTSIVARAVVGRFDSNYQPTIGTSFSTYFETSENPPIQLNIFDTAGGEHYNSLTTQYIRDTDAALIVFAKDDRKSFDSVTEWIKFVDGIQNDAKFFLIENKSDIEEGDLIYSEEAEEVADKNGMKFYEVSALSGNNIKELFRDVALECDKGQKYTQQVLVPTDQPKSCGC